MSWWCPRVFFDGEDASGGVYPEIGPRIADSRRVLRKHRWLMTGIFLLTVLTVGIWTFTQVPIYLAAATIMIEPEPPKVLNIQDVTPVGAMSPWDPAFYPTQYEIIKSKPVLTRTIETLNLKARLPEVGSAREPHRVVLASLSVEPKRNTRLIQIRYEHRDPVIARRAL